MGLREGTQVTIKQCGEPVIVEAGQARLGIAQSVSRGVHVSVTA